ncbi:MAG: MFS transporter [Legionellales bacterium]|nr:MFS transporter [Legionellales bacterium]
MNKMKYREIFSSSIGSGLEFYDFIIFGFFASTFAPLFFPAENIFLSTLWSYTAFAIGFIFRPLGGLLFGHMGDRLGRKSALSSSIILMGFSTLLIGILPTYEQIGVLAPLLLVLARIMQGISAGGESPGGMIFALEHSPSNKKGFAASLVLAGLMSGTLLATIISYVSSIFPAMSWRIPFILGFFVAFLGRYIRNKSDETSAYEQAKQNKQLVRYPILSGLKRYPKNILLIAIASSFSFCAFVVHCIYLPSYLKTTSLLPISNETIDLSIIFVVIVSVVTAPVVGYMSDRIGKAKIAKKVIVAMSVFLFIFYSNLNNMNENMFLWGQFIYAILNGSLVASLTVFLIESISDTSVKYSSYSFASGLGVILSGFFPMLAATIMSMEYGGLLLGLCLFIVGVVTFIALSDLQKLRSNILLKTSYA